MFLDDGAPINNERLEFLGDAVIESIVSDFLFIEFPEADEGFLSRLRSRICPAFVAEPGWRSK